MVMRADSMINTLDESVVGVYEANVLVNVAGPLSIGLSVGCILCAIACFIKGCDEW
jgi:hypothetical protein